MTLRRRAAEGRETAASDRDRGEADLNDSATSDGAVDVSGERLVAVYVARSAEEFAEVMRILEEAGLAPVDLDGPPGTEATDGPGASRIAVPASRAAKARRLIARWQGLPMPWLAGLNPRARKLVARALVFLLVVPIVVGVAFGVWFLGVIFLGGLVVFSLAIGLVEGARRWLRRGG